VENFNEVAYFDYTSTKENEADILTRELSRVIFERHRAKIIKWASRRTILGASQSELGGEGGLSCVFLRTSFQIL
jgi:hypothetical protein